MEWLLGEIGPERFVSIWPDVRKGFSEDSPLEAFAAESTAQADSSTELSLQEPEDEVTVEPQDDASPEEDIAEDSDGFKFSLDTTEEPAPEDETESPIWKKEDSNETLQLSVPDALLTRGEDDKDRDRVSAQQNPPDLSIKEETGSAVEKDITENETGEAEATLAAIEDLFTDAGTGAESTGQTQSAIPSPDTPPIDYEALMALKAENQARAHQMFEGKKKPRRTRLILVVSILVLFIALASVSGWYFWMTGDLDSTGRFPVAQTPVTPAPVASGQTEQEMGPAVIPDVSDQGVTTIAAEDSDAGKQADAQTVKTGSQTTERIPVVSQAEKTLQPAKDEVIPDSARGTATLVREESQAPTGNAIVIKKGKIQNLIDMRLNKAWNMFQQGDYATADARYAQVLKDEPFNRDALLGRAAISMRNNDFQKARKFYVRLLERDPRDALAQSSLISLLGRQDPVAGISRINLLLEKDPKAPWLHFTLGNLYAAQSRWIEAQQAYFSAWSIDSNNPDYVYNLAIAMDHMGNHEQALKFYQKALDLADSRSVSFPTHQVMQRIQGLAPGP